jgi:hypothetical protein
VSEAVVCYQCGSQDKNCGDPFDKNSNVPKPMCPSGCLVIFLIEFY